MLRETGERKKEKMKTLSASLSSLFLRGEDKEILRLGHIANASLLESSTLYERGICSQGSSVLLIDSRHLRMIDVKYLVKTLSRHGIQINQMYQCTLHTAFRDSV